ncbi:Tex family protein [Marinicellulosiphila megalodicopiae]|uniref:Tex family protein n=1 Tax=Marinicellulosiphila megalodicopiae TaxID=2724896 RepID=UPI003BAF276D
MSEKIFNHLAKELNVQLQQVTATVAMLDEGSTVPFIARYRKEVTGGLDDIQLRTLEERLRYLRELEDRRATVIASVEEQGKMTDALKKAFLEAASKTELEDLYLPYKQKRRTKAQIAIEAGLLPLADALLNDPTLVPEDQATQYLNTEFKIATTKDALDGARFILMERFAEDATLIGAVRNYLDKNADIIVAVVPGKEVEGEKFRDYFEHTEKLKTMPSHRALAVFRGRNEGILQFQMGLDGTPARESVTCESMICDHFKLKNENRPADSWLMQVVRWTWRVKLLSHIETDLVGKLREKSEDDAISVFAKNLKDLLLAAPAGARTTLGLDPGFRSGVKVVVVKDSGDIAEHGVIYPHQPQNQWQQAIEVLALLCRKYEVDLVAIGNGTASRETDKLVNELVKQNPTLKLNKIVVSEAGASVYSASVLAAQEFPDLDVTIRGAISIAKRLQDPLAELVKIDPKAIGVGQYQHDVSQVALARSLDAVVEDCVNGVGVDLNTASEPLLTKVSGLTKSVASQIIAFRHKIGQFDNRKQLLEVPRLGAKAFEQAAGFLKIANGSNPLDNSSVHPEAYSVIEAMLAKNNKTIGQIVGDSAFLRSIDPKEFANDLVGEVTIKDILKELEKPGRDPRPEFKTATFDDSVEEIKDLRLNMILEGVVTNVTNFGAFVDVGVHQDGLVHISALSHTFVEDPSKVVKAGDIVKVKVMEVDADRKRIALTMRLDDDASQVEKSNDNKPQRGGARSSQNHNRKQNQEAPANTMASLFAKAGLKK